MTTLLILLDQEGTAALLRRPFTSQLKIIFVQSFCADLNVSSGPLLFPYTIYLYSKTRPVINHAIVFDYEYESMTLELIFNFPQHLSERMGFGAGAAAGSGIPPQSGPSSIPK